MQSRSALCLSSLLLPAPGGRGDPVVPGSVIVHVLSQLPTFLCCSLLPFCAQREAARSWGGRRREGNVTGIEVVLHVGTPFIGQFSDQVAAFTSRLCNLGHITQPAELQCSCPLNGDNEGFLGELSACVALGRARRRPVLGMCQLLLSRVIFTTAL